MARLLGVVRFAEMAADKTGWIFVPAEPIANSPPAPTLARQQHDQQRRHAGRRHVVDERERERARVSSGIRRVEYTPDLRLVIYTPVAGESAQKARLLFAEE
jgi:hypothetical protein